MYANLNLYYKIRKTPSLVDFLSFYQLYNCKFIVIVPNNEFLMLNEVVLINERESNRKFPKIFAGKNLRMT